MQTALLTSRYALGMLVQQALLYVLVPIYTAYLTPTELGSWFLLLTSTTFVGELTKSPAAVALSRFFYHPKYKDKQNCLVDTLLVWYFISTLAVMTVYYLLAGPLSSFLFSDSAMTGPTEASAVLILTFGSSVMLLNYMRLMEMAWGFLLVSVLQAIATTIVALVLLVQYNMGVYALIYGYALGQGVQILVALFIVRRRWLPELDFRLIRNPLRFGFLSLPGSYGSSLVQTGDRYVVNALTSTAMVGIYSFGSLIANTITILFTRPIVMGTSPIVRRLECNPDQQKQVISRIFLYSSWLGCVMAIGIGCMSKPLVHLLAQSESYYGAWIVIPPLAFARVLHGLTDTASLGLFFGNRPGVRSLITLGAGCLNLVLNLLMIPFIGVLGAAVATLITMLVWNAVYCWISYQIYKLRLPAIRVLSGVLVAVFLFAFSLIFSNTSSLFTGLLLSIVLCLCYPVILVVCGVVDRDDREEIAMFFRRILSMVG